KFPGMSSNCRETCVELSGNISQYPVVQLDIQGARYGNETQSPTSEVTSFEPFLVAGTVGRGTGVEPGNDPARRNGGWRLAEYSPANRQGAGGRTERTGHARGHERSRECSIRSTRCHT